MNAAQLVNRSIEFVAERFPLERTPERDASSAAFTDPGS